MPLRRKKPTMNDVARLAGVSQTTVSFILSGRADGHDRISVDTRQRVLQAISQLGYVPNQAAQSLRKQRTRRVALFIDRLGAPYFESLAQSLQAAAEQRGYSFILLMGKSDEQQRRVLQTVHQGLVDGIFFTSLRNVQTEDLQLLSHAGLAVVVYDNRPAVSGVDFVHYPAFEASQMVVDYLVNKGHRRIAFIGFKHSHDQSDMRTEGHLAGIEKHGLAADATLLEFDEWLSRERIYSHVTALLKQPQRPTAVVCGSDIGGICAIAAVQDAGLRVPEDVAVTGFGNIPEGSYIRPSLTTVGPDPLDFTPGIELLFNRLEGKAVPKSQTWMMAWKLISRASA